MLLQSNPGDSLELMPLVVQAEPVAVIFKDAAEGQELQAMHAAAAAAVV